MIVVEFCASIPRIEDQVAEEEAPAEGRNCCWQRESTESKACRAHDMVQTDLRQYVLKALNGTARETRAL
jgi:hypothetical protein